MSFTIFWKGKLPFQAIKTRTSKSRNIDIFQIKGLTHGSGPKMAIFLFCFFLANIGQENVFYDILDRKITFLGYKKKNLKSRTIDIIPKGVNQWFRSKNGHFSNFFFLTNIGQENVFYDFLERKKAIKTRSSKVKKLTFF